MSEIRKAAPNTIHMAEKTPSKEPTDVVELLEEDDEFEEFEPQEWTAAAEDVQDPDMWQDGWEDDEDDADFTAALRKELAATEGAAPPTSLAPTAAMES